MIIIQLAEKGTGVHYNQLWDVRENDFYSQPLKIGNAKKQKKNSSWQQIEKSTHSLPFTVHNIRFASLK